MPLPISGVPSETIHIIDRMTGDSFIPFRHLNVGDELILDRPWDQDMF